MNKEEITDEEIKKIIQFYYDGCDNFDYEREYTRKLEVYISQLQKKVELGEHYKHLYSELKKQKDNVVEYVKEIKKHREEGLTITEYKAKWRSMFDYLESDEIINNLLRMLGEIE